MRIRSLEVFEVRIPFRVTFQHALASRSEGHGIIVRATADDGAVGHGECVPRSYVTEESVDSVLYSLQDGLAAPFLGREFADFDMVVTALEEAVQTLPRHRHAAFCCIDLALLDLAGRRFGVSAGEILGPVATDPVVYSGVVSADGREAGIRALPVLARLGLERVKLKVGTDLAADRELLLAARAALGDRCRLRIDANCAWTPEEALGRLEAWRDLDLEAVEQPVAAADLRGLAWLSARSPTPVIVDESLASVADAEALIAAKACHAFNLRVSKCGGLVNVRRIRDLAKANGMRCQVGAQVGETVLLSAAGRQLAARTPDLLFAEGSFGTLLLTEDLGLEDLTFGPQGRAPALRGPGLGAGIDPARLRRHAVRRLILGDLPWEPSPRS
jgi:L-alanine-DL-glutamate epimerase-like enolase superfamily enzyme